MSDKKAIAGYAEIVGLSVLALALSRMGLFLLLFPLPLIILGYRKGAKYALGGALMVVFISAAVLALNSGQITEPQLRRFYISVELFIPLVLAASVVITFLLQGRQYEKMLLLAAAAAIAAYPLILYFSGVDLVVLHMEEQIKVLMKGLMSMAEKGENSEVALVLKQVDPGKLIPVIYGIFLRYSLFSIFIAASFDWFVGRAMTGGIRIKRFRVRENMIWLLLGFWSAVLIDIVFGLGKGAFFAWNGALILSSIYGLQGFAICKAYVQKRGMPKQMQRTMLFLLVMLGLTPGINGLVLLGLPGLGVAELWIKMRDI